MDESSDTNPYRAEFDDPDFLRRVAALSDVLAETKRLRATLDRVRGLLDDWVDTDLHDATFELRRALDG